MAVARQCSIKIDSLDEKTGFQGFSSALTFPASTLSWLRGFSGCVARYP